jgi:hypothetical protein
MKKVLVVFLLLGAIEIFYGVLWGRLQIYKFEAPMIHDLSLTQAQYKAFGEYITRFKDQWEIVTVFGTLNIAGSVIGLILTSRASRAERTHENR